MDNSQDMEVEEQNPSPSTNNFKRLALKNSIQTNFGDDYVFQIVSKDDWTSMAVSLSSNAIKLYSPMSGQYIGECKGHSSMINQISFSGPSSPHVLYSCSSDSTVRAWDSRSFQQVSCISTGSLQEVFNFSFGGASGNLLAAACKSQIYFWDWRTMKQTACLEECHTEDVTQVLNVGTSVGKVGFFGEANQKLWCLTHIETLSVWDWVSSSTEANFEDARTLASESWILDNVDYLVYCHYSAEVDRLWVIGGTNAGTFGYFPVKYGRSGRAIGSPEAVFRGGHMGIVRSVLPLSRSSIPGVSTSNRHGVFGWTGAEDGRLCCWFSDATGEANCSWVSSALVEKSPNIRRKKSRHYPY